MPTNIFWDDADAQTIIHIQYLDKWTWEEYFAIAEQGRQMALSVPHRVDYIADLSRGVHPRAGSPITNGKTVLRRLAPNAGVVVNVTTLFETALLNIFKQFDKELGSRMLGAASVGEARQMIAHQRQIRPLSAFTSQDEA